MRVEPDSRKRMGETRRYFPDWTHRSLASGPELEADHNSYLAGGYAEEFGYRAQPGYSRGAPCSTMKRRNGAGSGVFRRNRHIRVIRCGPTRSRAIATERRVTGMRVWVHAMLARTAPDCRRTQVGSSITACLSLCRIDLTRASTAMHEREQR